MQRLGSGPRNSYLRGRVSTTRIRNCANCSPRRRYRRQSDAAAVVAHEPFDATAIAMTIGSETPRRLAAGRVRMRGSDKRVPTSYPTRN
jgi:hypothetical protein